RTLNHTNLVQLIGIVDDNDDSLCIVTEYMGRGSLLDYLRTRGRSVITQSDQIKFARDVCSGMKYLEEKKLVHRDLAARNVLLHDNGVAKVSDFGLAVNDVMMKTAGCKIPVKWTAPEALKHNKFTCKSDVWSFGVLLWEIYTFGRVPYPRISLNDVLAWLEEGNRMDRPDGCPEEMYKVMKMAWRWQADERPTFKDIHSLIIECASTDV
ncbi:hypothetical protein HELRODRAFT_68803, partial [Helobdella robusta]|uniref:Protein kinase domain-containing protein n=1 Tax=Helobdella robusta TaxID=6412 RepID=T1FZJ6_HELRO